MDREASYQDRNIEVYEDHLRLKKYYFLAVGEKKIPFSQIERFEEVRLTYFNGMSRHEHTWLKPRWPFDWKCKKRTEAVWLKLKNKKLGIGIAGEEPRALALILHKKVGVAVDASLPAKVLEPVPQN